jgi:hypothetical protein
MGVFAEPFPSKGYLLASQFLPLANMPKYEIFLNRVDMRYTV